MIEAYAPYLVVFLIGALVSWVVGYADTRISHPHRLAVGAAHKAAAKAVKPLVVSHEAVHAALDKRLRALEAKVLGNV